MRWLRLPLLYRLDFFTIHTFIKCLHERTLRKRDEVFLSVLEKAAFLVSVKARHGAEEERDLLADIGGLQDKFVISDWLCQTSEKNPVDAKSLSGGVEWNQRNSTSMALLYHHYSIPDYQSILGSYDILHNFPANAGGALGSLIAEKLASKLANKFC
jgi:hypothetical protein